MTLYEAAGRLVLTMAGLVGGLFALQLILEYGVEIIADAVRAAVEKRRRSYKRVAHRHGRLVR